MTGADLGRRAAQAGEAALAGVDRAALPGFMRRLDEAALLAMAATLHGAGAFVDGRAHTTDQVADLLRVAVRHRWILRRWLTVLTREGWLRHDDDTGRHHHLRPASRADLAAATRDLDAARAGLGYPAAMTRFFTTSAEHLPELLRDEIPLQALLFADDDLATAEAAYKDNVINGYLNAVAGRVLGDLAGRRRGPEPLRVLELGAGVGGTTADVLPALADRPVVYQFTDVSRFFLEAARERFAGYGFLRYGLFDINADVLRQGVPAGSQDVLLAANVAHNAVDVTRLLGGLRDLLAADGVLLLIESCREHHQIATSMQFLMSARPGVPAAGSADLRASTDRIFLTREQWLTQLTAAGFTPMLCLPTVDDPLAALGQHVFVAGR
ncbi:class I SAM-dependent methyltransferase [Micromonospora sp. NPDC023633]|uniref:class I SAM-dependent methyltransferase n=1 Tax=Micromonospora sp. NPDC023633 TaxID=3154320 RepID=UPI0033D0D74E